MGADVTKLMRRLDKAGYEATLGGINTPVIVGGSDSDPADEFEPAVNMSFHPTPRHPRGEAFIHMRHIDGIRTVRTETENDGEITHEAGGSKHIFKVVDGNLKWDMDFANTGAVPPIIRFRIRHSAGLEFHKQVMSQEEIDMGNSYAVPEVEGSYAVYLKDRQDNKYQTGKVCHIYSGFFVDQLGAKSPLLKMTLVNIEAGVKGLNHIVTPEVQKWLDAPARFGVIRLDPTLGYDTEGSLYFTMPTDGPWLFFPWLMPEDGVISAMHSYVRRSSTGTSEVYMGAYETDASSPYNPSGKDRVCYGGGKTPPNTVGVHQLTWNSGDADFTIDKTLTSGVRYRLGNSQSTDNKAQWVYDNSAGYTRYKMALTPPNDYPDPCPAVTSQAVSVNVSMWLVYAPAAGPTFNRSRIVNTGSTGPQNRSTIANA